MSLTINNLTPSLVRGMSIVDLSNAFSLLKTNYNNDKNNWNNLTPDERNSYKNRFEILVNELSSQNEWKSASASGTTPAGYIGTAMKITDCSDNCSRMLQIRKDILDLTTETQSSSNIPVMLSTQSKTINKNKEILLTRKAQYEMAVQRNEHRRKMILTVASLNTLLLLFYYMMVYDAPPQPPMN